MNHLFASYQRNSSTSDGARFAAQPLKQWRKQYTNNLKYSLGYSRASVGMPMDRPGGSSRVDSEEVHCATCQRALLNKVEVFNESDCASCNPIKNKTKPLRTSFINTPTYLQSRCATYDQKLSIEAVPDISYFSEEGLPLEPTDSATGPQVRQAANCYSNKPPLECNATIYKPNNTQFAQQGGVSSSSRLARLKYNTLNNVGVNNNGHVYSGSVFNTAAGAEGLNSGRYHTEPTDYFTKYKPQPVVFPHKNGKKTYCSNTICMSI
jgi:hypothetical protein